MDNSVSKSLRLKPYLDYNVPDFEIGAVIDTNVATKCLP